MRKRVTRVIDRASSDNRFRLGMVVMAGLSSFLVCAWAQAQDGNEAAVAALKEEAETLDYERARFHPIHFQPRIATASDAECLVCHQEILDHEPLAQSPAGVAADETIAWYQTLDTYEGDQASFHWRHIESQFAKEVMNLDCTFCHKGNDPREESPFMAPDNAMVDADSNKLPFHNRKMVNTSDTCLRCHGAFPESIMGLAQPWPEMRKLLENDAQPNGCLSCHGVAFRTNRHQVTYLHAENIEAQAKEGSSDSCYGCHGARAWYRISYPYPRNPWPTMSPNTPAWAEGRPTESDSEYQLPSASK